MNLKKDTPLRKSTRALSTRQGDFWKSISCVSNLLKKCGHDLDADLSDSVSPTTFSKPAQCSDFFTLMLSHPSPLDRSKNSLLSHLPQDVDFLFGTENVDSKREKLLLSGYSASLASFAPHGTLPLPASYVHLASCVVLTSGSGCCVLSCFPVWRFGPLPSVPRPEELPTVHNSTPGVIASSDRRSAASMLAWNAVPCVTCTLRVTFQCVDCVPVPVCQHLRGDVTFEEALFFRKGNFFARGKRRSMV